MLIPNFQLSCAVHYHAVSTLKTPAQFGRLKAMDFNDRASIHERWQERVRYFVPVDSSYRLTVPLSDILRAERKALGPQGPLRTRLPKFSPNSSKGHRSSVFSSQPFSSNTLSFGQQDVAASIQLFGTRLLSKGGFEDSLETLWWEEPLHTLSSSCWQPPRAHCLLPEE